MYSACRWILTWIVLAAGTLVLAEPAPLRVCADSNNLPYSNVQKEGFENKLAEMVARDLGRSLQYVWWPKSPGRSERMFKAGACDVVMGVPAKDDLANPTRPYYRSSYVFVTRKSRGLSLHSFDDPKLRVLRIGLPMVQENGTPAEGELARRGIIRNVVGYSVFGNSSKPNPPEDLLKAVARGEVDVAIAWGPLAGYFAQNSPARLMISPICQSADSSIPLSFDISMGVRRGDNALGAQLDREITRRHKEIQSLLRSYGIPVLKPGSESRSCK